jgi:S1-C subfamily serine protease
VLILFVTAEYRDYVSVCIKGEEGNSMAEQEKHTEPENLSLKAEASSETESEIGSSPKLELETEETAKDSKILRQGPWMHPFPIITGISLIALLASLFFANVLINRYSDELSKTDFFHAPPNLAQLIVDVQKSTMVIKCGDSQGSGWVISLGEVVTTAGAETKALDKKYPGSVVTNFHVIEDCVNNKEKIVTSNGIKEYESILFSYDKKNDLAIISTKLVLEPLTISDEPSPGWWSMSLGSPFGLENSISIGNIMNLMEGEVISTAPINPGNSGGPLVNSFGQVMGTNTWKLKGADGINVAKDVQLLCVELVSCNKPFWP